VIRHSHLAVAAGILLAAARPCGAQEEPGAHVPDTIVVQGARRLTAAEVLRTSGLAAHRQLGYRDVQHAIQALYQTGQFADVQLLEDTDQGRRTLYLRVREQPILARWTLKGVVHLSEHSVRDKVALTEGRPYNPAAAVRAEGRIDSLYRAQGYYLAKVRTQRFMDADSVHMRLVFDISEGRRVAISEVDFEGNSKFSDVQLVSEMKTHPEGFWWFRSGQYEDDKLREDLFSRLPKFYGDHGYVDFQVLRDTVYVNDTTGKAKLVVFVSEGDPRHVGSFEIVGNRRFSTDELQAYFPFSNQTHTGVLGMGGTKNEVPYFDQEKWEAATRAVQMLYYNNGYIYMNLRPDVVRRLGTDGKPVVDLRWVINEAQPATVNKVEIVGNDVTHERVIRDAITILPGDVFRQDALIRSYQNISNLGFFEQPLPFPDTRPANDQGDVDIVFKVTEKHTGNINFGASLGQGTGIGGFIGLDEPNLFGQGKRGKFQWQFGQNVNEFLVSYTDPAIRQTRVSGTLEVHDYRVRYTITNLGTLTTRGSSLQFGFPFGDRYTRLFLNYGFDVQTFAGASTNIAFSTAFSCNDCIRSSVGASIMRDTRIDMPFPTGGTMHQFGVSQSGGILGGTGDFQRIDLEGHWYAPLGQSGSSRTKAPIKYVMALSARSGFVFGYAPFFNQLFTMGGTQFGIPLRGYDEFSITPLGYDPRAQTGYASPLAFGKAFLALTGEIGVRLSQMFYVDLFTDAGNVWARASQFDPTRLFRGSGIGLSVVSPIGPIGIDWAYGFDKTNLAGLPAPGWKLHFRLGSLMFQ